MKIWIGESKIADRDVIKRTSVLYSYFYVNKNNPTFTQFKNLCFLDSGAFSAFSRKVQIDIEQYASFIKKYNEYLEVYANLDVIGDAEATLQNQHLLEKNITSSLCPASTTANRSNTSNTMSTTTTTSRSAAWYPCRLLLLNHG